MPLLQIQSLVRLLLLLVTASAVPAAANKAADHDAVESALESALPSYHYGAPIAVECMNRSSFVNPPPFPSPCGALLFGHPGS